MKQTEQLNNQCMTRLRNDDGCFIKRNYQFNEGNGK